MATTTIRDLVPLNCNSINGVGINNAQAQFLANITSPGTISVPPSSPVGNEGLVVTVDVNAQVDYWDIKGTFKITGVQVNATGYQMNYLVTSPGTAVAEKAVILDANKDIQLGTGDINCTDANASNNINVTNDIFINSTSSILSHDGQTTNLNHNNAYIRFDWDGTVSKYVKQIASNSGTDDWIFRQGNYIDVSTEKYVHAGGGASAIKFRSEGQDGVIILNTAEQNAGASGANIDWTTGPAIAVNAVNDRAEMRDKGSSTWDYIAKRLTTVRDLISFVVTTTRQTVGTLDMDPKTSGTSFLITFTGRAEQLSGTAGAEINIYVERPDSSSLVVAVTTLTALNKPYSIAGTKLDGLTASGFWDLRAEVTGGTASLTGDFIIQEVET